MREPGFYWVRLDGQKKTIGHWDHRGWAFAGIFGRTDDSARVEVIGPRIPEPEEGK